MMATPFLFPEGHGGGGSDDLWSGYRFWPQSPMEKLPSFRLPDNFLDAAAMDDASFDAFTSSFDSLSKPVQDYDHDRLELLEKPIRLARNDSNPDNELGLDQEEITRSPKGERSELSTEEIMRVAAAQYIQLSSLVVGDPSEIKLPFGLSLSDLTPYETKNVALVNMLMAAAEMVSNQECGGVNDVLEQCKALSSSTGNPAQRAVHYFVEALQERVKIMTGKGAFSRGAKEIGAMTREDVKRGLLSSHQVQIIANKQLPFPQVTHFTAIQTILDSIDSSKRIHIVDLSIKHGHQWTVLMHALASRTSCPIESLKITSVGSVEESIAATGEKLSSFARGLNLPFLFRTVLVPEMEDLREEMFDIEEGETVAVFNSLGFNNLIVAPKSLENLMRVICRIRPSIMMVLDVEAMLNSQSFITRFSEALFYYSAYFDCLGCMMGKCGEYRTMIERVFFAKAIKSVLATEGSERVVRRVGVRVWKAYFRRFGIVEADLSVWSMYQASLIVKQFVGDDSCTLEKCGKALLVGWKGTPLHFVSGWKFQNKKKDDTSGGGVHLGSISRFEEAQLKLRCVPIGDEPIFR